MSMLRVYYKIKPLIPRSIQISVRRIVAARKRASHKSAWPINPVAAGKPEGWLGWPEGKKFALVLNHDVDSLGGLFKVVELMEVEKRLGFRSSFNFVPEDYPTPTAILRRLADSGFEVGVHGLRHDGKLFDTPAGFVRQAIRINHYLKEWGATGFTSPSMLRNLALMAELDIEHGCSTFDTDPFEPQSDGVATIFPFSVANADGTRSYVELPYTLPQDHGLFVILREKDNRIWEEKLAWIAANGGMALLNSHPDYMKFDAGRCSREEYSVRQYVDFLEHIKVKYAGQYWHALPRELAAFWKQGLPITNHQVKLKPRKALLPGGIGSRLADHHSPSPPAKIWIDLDNTPHVPFFIPIIDELKKRGHPVVLTARDAFQVCELADRQGLSYAKIGRHYGKNRIMKILGLLRRTMQLFPFFARQRPALALSHGARSQILLCNLLRIPTILIVDYEHSRTIPMAHPKWLIVPESLFGFPFPTRPSRLRLYRGIKEDVYVSRFRPRPALIDELGLSRDDIVITVRPPANEANYHNPESDRLFVEFMLRVCRTPGTRVVLLPRNHQQEKDLRRAHSDWFDNGKTIVPARAVDGLNLLWFSDLVVSGGGTMNREAAALGIPVYSIFRGKTGAVDKALEQEGRLTMIKSPEEIWDNIQIVRRDKNWHADSTPRPALKDITDHIEDIVRIEQSRPGNISHNIETRG